MHDVLQLVRSEVGYSSHTNVITRSATLLSLLETKINAIILPSSSEMKPNVLLRLERSTCMPYDPIYVASAGNKLRVMHGYLEVRIGDSIKPTGELGQSIFILTISK